jgi:hypothetical protein
MSELVTEVVNGKAYQYSPLIHNNFIIPRNTLHVMRG